MAFTARSKISKPKGTEPTPFESVIAQHLFDLESSANAELKAQLKNIQIAGAKEVELGEGKKAVVVFVPFRLIKDVHRVQDRVVNELEKKLSGRHVVILGQRRILPKKTKNNRLGAQKRPHSRTLTAVHDALLEDIVYPSEIVDRRVRVRVDGNRSQRVTLDSRGKAAVEHKLETLSGVYKRLTGKDVAFQF
jgi:small subunit ribosomal protein S7e